MNELYRKWGRSVRFEGGRLVRVDEAGEATDDGGVFRTRPIDGPIALKAPDADAVAAAARQIEAIVKPLIVERLFVSEANLVHDCDGVQWRERHRRVHLSIARPPIRALVDLADFDFSLLHRIIEALGRAGGERDAPRRMRVAAHVGAALLPFVSMTKIQMPAPRDGKGRAIGERVVRGDPPNWFRPSYRLPPRRAWMHVRAEEFGEIDETLPVAIALLAQPGQRDRVLCVDGQRVFPTLITSGRAIAARPTNTWFPYAAGTFGAELVI